MTLLQLALSLFTCMTRAAVSVNVTKSSGELALSPFVPGGMGRLAVQCTIGDTLVLKADSPRFLVLSWYNVCICLA